MKHNKSYYVGLTAFVLSWLTFPAFAADNVQSGGDSSVTTKDVVVQADRAKEEAKWESQSTTVITSEDIERKQGKSVEDVIFNEVGVTRTVDAMGKVGISIRGADPRHTLIMVDGQPVLGDVAKYNGNGDELMRIGAENIERIEIVRGAASAKYGSDAIGGVVNVITKKPKDTASVQLNAEGMYHTSRYSSPYESSALPSNFYFRADTGEIGKFRAAGWTSKRDILPVYAKDKTITGDFGNGVETITNWQGGKNWFNDFKPSLRYYGQETSTGVSGSYEFNENHKLDFRITHDEEDVKRLNKSVQDPSFLASFSEPLREYHRTMKRDNYDLTYTGRAGKSDWNVNVNYGKTREDDSTVLSYVGKGYDSYTGYNTLAGVDWLEHRRMHVGIDANTAVNDKHFLSYGVGYTKERAEGSRLKNAPKTHMETINPWDYDKSLRVAQGIGATDEPSSTVHNYKLERTNNGLVWDKNSEYYGKSVPPLTYEEMEKISQDYPYYFFSTSMIQDETLRAKYEAFGKELASNFDVDAFNSHFKNQMLSGNETELITRLPAIYYGFFYSAYGAQQYVTYNGTTYGQDFNERENQLVIGEAEMKKTYAYVADTWQVNDDTIIMPSLRLDHSDLFGSKVTGNFGVTHNLNGNPHRRLKANIGTGYAEPGLGELYYNWEMFGGTGSDSLGWYWIGNKDLKPETSVNFDVSLEGENDRTYTKVSFFHNEIKNYMTSYFTGQLVDFNFNDAEYAQTPDRIYSFRNLGKAKITGIEAEVQHKFNDNWSAKLGYTWLHAVNDSDSDMPRKLLDRPTHKFDVSLNYKNDKAGFRGALWGSYYMHMLDSNSVSTESLFDKDSNGNYVRKKGEYKEKSFGIWNLLLEKDLGKDVTVYAGIDNLFNHQDDDRAFQDRVYRFGVNIKLTDLGEALAKPFHTVKDADGNPIEGLSYNADWFLSRPSDNAAKAGTVDVYGDYRLRSNMFKGRDKSDMRETKTAQASAEAARNYADKPGHGLEQRLRLGVNYQITDDMNLDVVGSTARHDTAYNVAEKRGLHDAYLEKAELNKKANKWDWTVGRIHEPMGVTGYWFGQEYDGVRAMYTDSKTQVVIGYGDFSQTTGVTDSAYNHKEEAVIQRAPTLSELLGLTTDTYNNNNGRLYVVDCDDDAQANYYEKFNAAGCVKNAETGKWETDPNLTAEEVAEAKLAVCRELVEVLRGVDAELKDRGDETYINNKWNFDHAITSIRKFFSDVENVDIKLKTSSGSTVNMTTRTKKLSKLTNWSGWDNDKYGSVEGLLQSDNIKSAMSDILDAANAYYNNGEECTYLNHNGEVISRDEAISQMFVSFVGSSAVYTDENSIYYGDNNSYNAISKFVYNWAENNETFDPVNGADIPLPGAPVAINQQGYLLKQDKIPAMDRAGFVKIRQQVADNVGLEAWKLNSFGEGAYDASGREMRIADVLGVGAKIRLGSRSMLSFDYGQNHSDMGKYFHGGNAYGIYNGGSTPDFWVARLDVGIADTDVPGSWNAYFDYKSFDHGAFLGGTGADLPDRYLDGIRSFTAGFGYVPARNFLLEASYTFDAHSTQQRDTLYTPESFSLGDYTRVTLTYKF